MPTARIIVLADTADATAKLDALAGRSAAVGTEMGAAGAKGGKAFGDAMDAGTTRAGKSLKGLSGFLASWGLPVGPIDSFAQHLEAASTKGQKFGATMAEIGKVSLLGGLAGIGAAVAISVDGYSKLQKQMEMIHTQAGASQAEVDKMTRAVESMAGPVGTGPQTLAEGLYHIESAGMRGAQALSILKIAAEGAQIGNANLTDVTNALDAAVVSGISGAKNFQGAMGALNATVGAGDMTMQNLADAMGTGILATAKTFGLSLNDVGAALATFGDNNIRGAQAATRLRQAIVMMGAPSAAAAKALATIGMSSTEIGQDMRSGGLVGALEDLRSHLIASGATATQQAAVLARAFGGGRTSSGILLLLDQLDRLQTKEKAVSSGAGDFGKDWTARTKTLSFLTDQLSAGLKGLSDSFGQDLEPTLLKVGKGAAEVATDFISCKPAIEGTAAVIAVVLGGAIGAFVGGKVASLVSGVSRMVTWMRTLGASSTATAAEMGVADDTMVADTDAAAVGIDGALLGTGIGAALVLLGIAAALLATHWKAVWNDILSWTSDAANFIIAHSNMIALGVTVMLGPIGLVLAAVVELATHWQSAWSDMQIIAKGVAQDLEQIFDTMINSISMGFGDLENSAISAINGLLGGVRTVAGALSHIPGIGHLFGGLAHDAHIANVTPTGAGLPTPGFASFGGLSWKSSSPIDLKSAFGVTPATDTGGSALGGRNMGAAGSGANLLTGGVPGSSNLPSGPGNAGVGNFLSGTGASSSSSALTPAELAIAAQAITMLQGFKVAGAGGTSASQQGATVGRLTGELTKVHQSAMEKLVSELNATQNTSDERLASQLVESWNAMGTKLVTIIDSDTKTANARLASLQNATTSASLISLEVSVGSAAKTSLNTLTTELVSTHNKNLMALASQLEAQWQVNLSDLRQALETRDEIAQADTLKLYTDQLSAQTTLAGDAAAKEVQFIQDASTALTDAASAMTTAVQDQTTIISDAFSAIASKIGDASQAASDAATAQAQAMSDATKISTDTLAERGLYGLNLQAQKAQVVLDKMTAGFDASIAFAQGIVDKDKSAADVAEAAAKAMADSSAKAQDKIVSALQQHLDAVTQQQNAMIAPAQHNLDAVTKAQQALVDKAQKHVDLLQNANAPQAAINAAQAQLTLAQNTASYAEAQANARLQSADRQASIAEAHATAALDAAKAHQQAVAAQMARLEANAQGQASVTIAKAEQTLQTVENHAKLAEQREQDIVNLLKEQAQTQFAGTGTTINVYGIPANDAAAISDTVGWQLRTQIGMPA